MLWEDNASSSEETLATDAVDLAFSMQCRQLPVDHLYALSCALQQVLPTPQKNRIGVHEIHIAGSQNGWERPDPALGQYLVPSRRTRLHIRVPGDQAEEIILKLQNHTLDVDGCQLMLGAAKKKPLACHDTLYARHVLMGNAAETKDENLFLQRMAAELEQHGIKVRKALCGKTSQISTADTPLLTRSLMIADLNPAESILLQQKGLGEHQHLGCGLFLPMKGIQHPAADASNY
ncbi:type I-MYXAN CRISPR-associated protein Cas6/Cmx6 [Thiolapillus sp.]